MRHFHSYGPVNSKAHFCVQRQALITQGIEQLIGREENGGHYFTIWAPRQTGKTWLMRELELHINQQYPEKFTILQFSLGKLKGISLPEKPADFPEAFGRLIKRSLPGQAEVKNWDDFSQLFSKTDGLWDRPLILLIDEVDTIPLSLIDLMVAQFREIYLDRQNNWLHGLALVGVRAVLGIESKRGSPFNIQKSLRVPNLTPEEVTELYHQYQEESGQQIVPTVVEKVYDSTQGQPGLVSWFGELLTEKYNPGMEKTLDEKTWKLVWLSARAIEPNNTLLNIIAKAKELESQEFLITLFTNSNIPFFFHHSQHNYLYLHGIIEPELETLPNGEEHYVCRFSSPFVQQCLYDALSQEIIGSKTPALALDPLDKLTDVFGDTFLNLPALLTRYKDYLSRLKAQGINLWKDQPRRKTDLNLIEAVGHFYLFNWLLDAVGEDCIVSPEFPAGKGQVDLHLLCGHQRGIIEVKSFVKNSQIKSDQDQAANYAKDLGIDRVTVALFIPVLDETVLKTLTTIEVVNGVEVTVVAIGWV
ncbi:AAA-like domain-containing protein [Candidatus Parabeggiatoa sp. HSG14]|uniref:AAA-like domain-containing protein n=1 Tax=Candidatus Parabeggiatoa sp. HSG14 TaxID=3055593 RepID=UPI0025A76AF3|nr:AAA-like domain-containing protein [Thiotrichales bacterium HSG14]